jgi:mono/diheme cytochrome c family protein
MRITQFLCVLLLTGVGCDLAYAQTLTAAQRGRVDWFKWNCVGCHGDNAKGGMGPNIVGTEYGDLYEAVLQGDAREGGMINFSSLPSSIRPTTNDLTDIAAYLASIGKPGEPKFVVWWTTPPH